MITVKNSTIQTLIFRDMLFNNLKCILINFPSSFPCDKKNTKQTTYRTIQTHIFFVKQGHARKNVLSCGTLSNII